mgnify:FL=1
MVIETTITTNFLCGKNLSDGYNCHQHRKRSPTITYQSEIWSLIGDRNKRHKEAFPREKRKGDRLVIDR